MRYVGEPIKIRLFRGMPGSEKKAPLRKRLGCKFLGHDWNWYNVWNVVDLEDRLAAIRCESCRKYLR